MGVVGNLSTQALSVYAAAAERKAEIATAKVTENLKALENAKGRGVLDRLSSTPVLSDATSTSEVNLANASEQDRVVAELRMRGDEVLDIVRVQRNGVLSLFGLDGMARTTTSMAATASYESTSVDTETAAVAPNAAAPSASGEVGDGALIEVEIEVAPAPAQKIAIVVADPPLQPSHTFDFEWANGDAAPDFSGDFQLGGGMTFTAEGQYDDLSAGSWQRLFDFGNGAWADNVVLSQSGSSNDMAFQIINNGTVHQVVAENSIVEGEKAIWTARVDDDGTMSIFKNGEMLVSGAGQTIGAVARASNHVGSSNFSSDANLQGTVYGIGINDAVLTDAEIAAISDNGNPWQV